MKQFFRSCPFLASVLLSGLLFLDFYIMKNELVPIKLNQDVINVQNNNSSIQTTEPDEEVLVDDHDTNHDGKDHTFTGEEIINDDAAPNSQYLENEEKSDWHNADDEMVADEFAKLDSEEIDENDDNYTDTDDNDTKVWEPVIGVTEFITYEPVEVKSPYYSDPGKKALTTTYPYETVDESYFDDAAFIGDSRTIGLFDYSGFTNADFYADNGFCAYVWKKKGVVTLQGTRNKVNLEEALSNKHYGKVYIMLGMNDCGYGTTQTFKQDLLELIEMVERHQPAAIIYLMANLNTTKANTEKQKIFNTIHVNDKNVAIAECANGMNRFYLDYNDLYNDEEGYLKESLTFDGIHLYGNQYGPWITFLKEHAVVRTRRK